MARKEVFVQRPGGITPNMFSQTKVFAPEVRLFMPVDDKRSNTGAWILT
jgi:hypothetical protein